jgi:phosphatidylserine decarboxylase
MKDALVVSALSLVPRNHGARVMGRFARSRASRWVRDAFVRVYGVDLGEAEHPLSAYPTLEDLFTRRLKAGVRPVDGAPDGLVSPVDGRCAAVGRTVDGAIEVAPGRSLSIAALLGHPLDGERDVAVLYLSPRDYHRVHVPREGRAVAWNYVPGTLWPVFPAAVRRVPDLFARNERATVSFALDGGGSLDVVLVGAFGVGRITLSVCALETNAGQGAAAGTVDVPLGRSDELGVFHLGSTVILVAPIGQVAFSINPGEVVQVGRVIGRVGAR